MRVGQTLALVLEFVVVGAGCSSRQADTVTMDASTSTAVSPPWSLGSVDPLDPGRGDLLRSELEAGYRRWVARRPDVYVPETDISCFCEGPSAASSVVTDQTHVRPSRSHRTPVRQPDDEGVGVSVDGMEDELRDAPFRRAALSGRLRSTRPESSSG
jgi:hypothetical protein